MLSGVGKWLFVVCLSLLVPSTAALSADYPLHLWTVSDDTLSTPIGAIGDVVVSADGVVHLLDTQLYTVHRINIDGSELPPLGRRGEGPGELTHPCLLAAYPDGDITVLSHFFVPAVCFTPEGELCVGPDLSSIRDHFTSTTFVVRAQSDEFRRLYVIAMTSGGALNGQALSVFRVAPGDDEPVALFSDRKSILGKSVIDVSSYTGPYIPRCWDVDAAGRLLFADPGGRYSVVIGHPMDGASRVIELSDSLEVDSECERAARSMGLSSNEMPRIADVLWVGRDRFLVKPMSTVMGPTITQGGTFEMFDNDGQSYGRFELYSDVEGRHDSLFLRNGFMVVVEGGWSARRAAAGIDPGESSGVDTAAIHIHAYDLRVP